jgi:hypothetical protein
MSSIVSKGSPSRAGTPQIGPDRQGDVSCNQRRFDLNSILPGLKHVLDNLRIKKQKKKHIMSNIVCIYYFKCIIHLEEL